MGTNLRKGIPNIYATWLAKLIGQDKCKWSAWFKAHYWYTKVESMAGDLVQWNKDHNALMAKRVEELRREGFTDIRQELEFTLDWPNIATVKGKADIVASRESDNLTLVVDGKTGKQRKSDLVQVITYLYALTKRPAFRGRTFEGEVQYKTGDVRMTVTGADVTQEFKRELFTLIKEVASPTPPPRVPSKWECQYCNIGHADCPDRYKPKPDEDVITIGEEELA